MGRRVISILLSVLIFAVLVRPAAAAPISFNFAGTWSSLPEDTELWLPGLTLATPVYGTVQTEESGPSGSLILSWVEMTAGTALFVSNSASTFQTADGLWHSDGASGTSYVAGTVLPLPLDAFRLSWAPDGTGTFLFTGLGFGVAPNGTRLIGSGTFTVVPEAATVFLCMLGAAGLMARQRFAVGKPCSSTAPGNVETTVPRPTDKLPVLKG